MNPDSELDQFLRTMGQVEPEPEPEPNEPEKPSGGEVPGKEDPV
jgi:hypothetical protein